MQDKNEMKSHGHLLYTTMVYQLDTPSSSTTTIIIIISNQFFIVF
jgi:hypothetical protein